MKLVFDIRQFMTSFAFYGGPKEAKRVAQRQFDQIEIGGTWQWDCQGLTPDECLALGFGVNPDWLVDANEHRRLTDYEYKEFLKGWL